MEISVVSQSTITTVEAHSIIKQRYLMPEGINARVSGYYICWHSITIVCYTFVSTHAPQCCFITQLSGYQSRGKDRTKSKKLDDNIIFVHDLWKSLLIHAMMIPATLIINMGDFTTTRTFDCCYWARNSIWQCFYATLSGLGLGLQGLYSATNCADNIPGRFTILLQNQIAGVDSFPNLTKKRSL